MEDAPKDQVESEKIPALDSVSEKDELTQEELDTKYKVHSGPSVSTADIIAVEVVKSVLKNEQERLTKNIGVLSDENTDTQEKVDAGVEITTSTPVISNLLKTRFSFLNFIDGLNGLQKNLRNKTKTTGETIKEFTESVLDSVTFGLSGGILGFIRKGEVKDTEEKVDKGLGLVSSN